MKAFSSTGHPAVRAGLFLLGALAPALAQAQAQAPQLTRAPELVQFVEAAYPESELEQRRSATVVLAITIGADGNVEDVAVQQSVAATFDQAALDAARKFVFRPAEVDGVPSRIQILYQYQFTPPPEAPKHALFAGRVRSRSTGQGLAGIEVRLSSGQAAVTDADGRFRIEQVEPGEQTVTLQGERLAALATQETFQAGQQLEANYDVELAVAPSAAGEASDDMEIEVTAPALRKQLISTEVTAREASRLPGTQGDVLRVVENLPGVARGALGSGQLIVWGAEPEDTRVYVDGVPVPRLYHDGGLRSIMSSDFVAAVDLIAGGYGAAFGRGLGGLVTIDTVDIATQGVRGSVSLDVLDVQGSIKVPITPKLSAALALRRGHLGELLSGAVRDDIEDYIPIPSYHDGQARVRFELDRNQTLELTGLLSSDTLTRSAVGPDPTRNVRESRELDFGRIYLSYRARAEDGSTFNLTPYFGWDTNRLSNLYGGIATNVQQDSVLGGARVSWRHKPAPWLALEVGLDAEISTHNLQRRGSIGAPPREGDIRVFGQAPPDRISADTWDVTSIGLAPYVELDLELFDGTLHVLPGLRVDPNITNVSKRTPAETGQPELGIATHRFELEPRLSLRYAITSALTVKAAWGIYHQAPQPEDLSASFGNPSLPSAGAMHWVLGLAWQVLEGLSAELTGFYQHSADLPARSSLSSPLAGQALVADGEGRAYGQQILLRQEIGQKFFGWISYSLVHSQRRASDGADYRLSDYDQTHVLTALASYDIGAGFEVGARVRYATGFPRTDVIDAFYDVRRDQFQPVFGDHNELRIPAFFAVDVRGAKKFSIGDTTLDVYIEVQNISNHENAEEIVYDPDYSERGYVTGLPILPIAGVKWSF